MTTEEPIDQKAIAAEMQGLAQTAILAWFADLLRVRIATQSPAQRALTLAILQDGLDQTLSRHATQTLPPPLSQQDSLKAALFKQVFTTLARELMATMGGGLTEEEKQAMG